MATPFATLGKGNGFPFCLSRNNLTGNQFVQNAPTLEQTMKSYWNLDSISFAGASFDPTNEPNDLICNPNDITGGDVDVVQDDGFGNLREAYSVSVTIPSIVVDGSNLHFNHGLSMGYNFFELIEGQSETRFESIAVDYSSTIAYPEGTQDTGCQPVYYGSPANSYIIGYERSIQISTNTNVTINGIPFIKNVTQTFEGFNFLTDTNPNPSCPNPSFPSAPAGVPTISFHTY